MDQGPLLPSLPLPHDYAISAAEQECLDHFNGGHTPRTVFPPLELQRDNSLHQPGDPTFPFTGTGAGRFLTETGVGHHTSRNGVHQHLDDPDHISASAGPNPGISTASIGNYSSQTRFSSFGGFTIPEPAPQYIQNPGSYGTSRHPSESDSVASGMTLQPLPNFRPTHPLDGVPPGYREQPFQQYTAQTLRSHQHQNQYGQIVDTGPRVRFTQQPGPTQHYGPMPSTPSSTHRGAAHDTPASQFPWPNLEVLGDITCQGHLVTPEVKAKVEKGFFVAVSDNKWTCYRRNYFSVTCSYEMAPYMAGVPLQLSRNGKSDNIQAMGVRMSAAVDGSGGKAIELVQHTPKRDNGPKTKIDVVKLYPTQPSARSDHGIGSGAMYAAAFQHSSAVDPRGPHGPFLPLQHLPDPPPEGGVAPATSATSYNYHNGSVATPSGFSTSHTFERVQFKQATANNGKRRASQQYFHLMIEVFADVRAEGDDEADWVKVAQRVSDKVVVRGRSPSHYQCEGGQSNAAPRGGAGGGRGGSGGSQYTHHAGPSYQSAGPPTYPMSSAYRQGYGLSHGSEPNTGRAYKMSPSDDSSEQAESVEGGMLDDGHPMDDRAMANIERGDHQQYHYYPGETDERSSSTSSGAYVPQLLPIPKVEAGLRYATEPRYYQNTAKFDHADSVIGTPLWESGATGPPSKFDGFTTSNGWFPPGSAGPHPGFL